MFKFKNGELFYNGVDIDSSLKYNDDYFKEKDIEPNGGGTYTLPKWFMDEEGLLSKLSIKPYILRDVKLHNSRDILVYFVCAVIYDNKYVLHTSDVIERVLDNPPKEIENHFTCEEDACFENLEYDRYDILCLIEEQENADSVIFEDVWYEFEEVAFK